MSIDKPAVAVVAILSMAVNIWLWTENSVLRERLAASVPSAHVAAVADACHGLVTVNRSCLAFGQRVREMLDAGEQRETAAVQWARLWDGQVLSGAGGTQQGGPGGRR